MKFVAEFISQKKTLGGLLFLLPEMFRIENGDGGGTRDDVNGKGLMKNVLNELERLLIHVKMPVSNLY